MVTPHPPGNSWWLPGAYLLFCLLLGGVLALGRPPEPIQPPPPLPDFDVVRALEDVRSLVGGGEPRVPESPSHDRAREALVAKLSALGGLEVETEGFHQGGRRHVNLLARLEGTGEGVIYLTAHYDTRPGTPGAVDNASGVGILLEAARTLSQGSWDRTLVFAFWDGEEEGLWGSRHHVQGLSPEERESILAMVSLDMPGWRGGRPVIHTFREAWQMSAPRIVPAWLPHLFLAAASRAGESLSIGDPWIPLHYQIGVRNMRVPFASDDGPFLEAGIPAVFLSNSSFLGFFPHYHKGGDTMEEVGEEALRECGRTLVAAVGLLDALPQRPPAGGEGYLLLGGFLLREVALQGLMILALAPVLLTFLRRGSALDRLEGAGLLLLGAIVVIPPVDPLRPAAMIPLLLASPLLDRRSTLAIKGVALAGLLPALSTFFFLVLVKLRFGAHAPLSLSPLDWIVLTVAPGLFLVRASRMERKVRAGSPPPERATTA